MDARGSVIFDKDSKDRPDVGADPRVCPLGSYGSRSWGKTAVLVAITLLILIILLDAGSYLIVTSSIPSRIKVRVGNGSAEQRVAERRLPRGREPRLIRSPETEHAKQARSSGLFLFHPVLGWDYPPNIVYADVDDTICSHGANGERTTCTSYDKTSIVTYGDSFTYCAGVKDSDTWQTFLARKIGQNVLNFGVGAYGTDQAFLKYQLHGNEVAKIAMLGVFPENINRIVNIYRPFYVYHESRGLTKPRFMQEGNGFRLESNPLKTVEDVGKLLDPDFIRQLGQLDYWYQMDQKLPQISFPYSFSLFRWRKPIFEQLDLSATRLLHINSRPVYSWNLFDEPEPFAIMCYIIDRFVETAHSRGSTPVIAILPYEDQVQELMDYRGSRFARLVHYLKEHKYRFVDVVQSIADMKPNRSQLNQWYKGHATPEGNKIVADIIAAYLQENRLLLQ